MKTRRLSNILVPTVALALGMGAVSCMKYEKKANVRPPTMSATSPTVSFSQLFLGFTINATASHILVRYATQQEAFDSLFTMNTRTIVAARDITEAERKALKAKYRSASMPNLHPS